MRGGPRERVRGGPRRQERRALLVAVLALVGLSALATAGFLLAHTGSRATGSDPLPVVVEPGTWDARI